MPKVSYVLNINSHDYPAASFDRLKTFLVASKGPSPVRKWLIGLLLALLLAAAWMGGYKATPVIQKWANEDMVGR